MFINIATSSGVFCPALLEGQSKFPVTGFGIRITWDFIASSSIREGAMVGKLAVGRAPRLKLFVALSPLNKTREF